MNNKWIRAAIPALLIHCSIGSVYCWSTFKNSIAEQIQVDNFSLGWAFSLAIFFLGMSAAFCGKFIEKDVHKSSLLCCIFFVTGMIGTGLCIQFLQGWPAVIGIYIFYGVIMGIGLGIGYLTPVKTLMLWFKENPGLATGISIMGFGLAKAIATPFMELIQNKLGVSYMFFILGIVYFITIFTGHLLLKKPDYWTEKTENYSFNFKDIITNKTFIAIWIIFFLNIHCGLAIISYEKQFLIYIGMIGLVSIIPSITAIANAAGRFGYSTLSDNFKDKSWIYIFIFISCSVISLFNSFLYLPILLIIMLIIINAGYGGGFSTLPTMLSSRFGIENISKIHGLALSAWGIAGLTGNNSSAIILKLTNNNYYIIIYMVAILYIVALIITYKFIKVKETKNENIKMD